MKTIDIISSLINENTDWKEKVSPDDHLVNALHIDSFDRLMLVSAIEDEFDISIDEESLYEIEYVSDVIDALNKKLNLKEAL